MSKPRFGVWKYRETKKTTFTSKATGKEVDVKDVDLKDWQKVKELYTVTFEQVGRVLYGILWAEPSGKQHKERSGFINRTLAQQAMEQKRRAVQDASAKGFDTVEGPKAAVLLKQAVQDRIDAQENADTKADYQSKLDNLLLPFFGNVPLATIKPAQVMEYIEKRKKAGAAAGTIKKDLALLSGTFSDAELKELVDRNPIRLARRGKKKTLHQGKKIVRFLSPAEELALLAVLPPRLPYYDRKTGTQVNGSVLRDAVPFSFLTGLREMEQARLTWADYDPERRVVRILEQKNGDESELPLCDAAAAILERLRAEALAEQLAAGKGNGEAAIRKLAIFRDPETRKPLSRFNNTGWQRALVKAGIDSFRWHDLRHTFGSRLAMGGASLQYVQRMMRHHSINQTLAYAHLCPEDNSTGIDFQGRKGVQLLDMYQSYPALLRLDDQGRTASPARELATLPA